MKSLLIKLLCLVVISGLSSACFLDSGGGGGSSGPQTVLVIGDSISAGGIYPGVPPWPSLLAGMIPESTVANQSTPGQKLHGGLAKVGGLLAKYQPNTLVVFYGSNNAIQGDTANFDPDLRSIIQTGKSAGAKVVVCTIPDMYGARAIYNGRVNSLNSIIKSVCGSEGAKVNDVHGEFHSAEAVDFPDGLHPNLDGQRIIAVSVRERI